MTTTAGHVERVDGTAMAAWLPQLDEWLLPGAFYGVRHTWPQLYRSDGEGMSFVLRDGERLLSHCACRLVTIVADGRELRACLLGSVATAPELRGRGLAGQVLAAALEVVDGVADHTLLWAERPELYARHGFAASRDEACLQLVRRPRREAPSIRRCEVGDHGALHALHEQKPQRVVRSLRTMSTLLTTPGMATFVLERDGVAVAYACCGKGADLQGHWHEVGGSDEDVAELLPAAMHALGQIDAFLLLPPYRAMLRERLTRHVTVEHAVSGPMVRSPRGVMPAVWVDGLDSV